MLSCMSMCFKWQMWNITDGQRKRWSFGKLPCKYSLKKKNSFISVFLRWSRFWAVKALLVVRNRKFAHLTIFRQFQTFPVRIWKFFKIKDLCSFGNESNRNSSLWLNLCTEKQTFPAFCKMRIIYEGEFVKRHNAIVAIFMKFLAAFTVDGGERILQCCKIFNILWILGSFSVDGGERQEICLRSRRRHRHTWGSSTNLESFSMFTAFENKQSQVLYKHLKGRWVPPST